MNYDMAVIQFPGSNCDKDAAHALQEEKGINPVMVHYNAKDAPEIIGNSDAIFIPGGFTYKDWGRAGLVASYNNRIMDVVREKAEDGTPVLGVCNGNQIGLEAHLLDVDVAMAKNAPVDKNGNVKRTISGFENRHVYMEMIQEPSRTAFTNALEKDSPFIISAAHAEGNYTMAKETFNELNERGMILFQYVDNNGTASPYNDVNPNGSVANIAGLTNEEGNVVLLMPHPERRVIGKFGKGFDMFSSMRNYLEGKAGIEKSVNSSASDYDVRQYAGKRKGDLSIILESKPLTVDTERFTLNHLAEGLVGEISLGRRELYEIQVDGRQDVSKLAEEIIRSAQMIKTNKHAATLILPDGKRMAYDSANSSFEPAEEHDGEVIDVFDKKDYKGDAYAEILTKDFEIDGIKSLQTGTRWIAKGNESSIDSLVEKRLFHHPLLHNMERR